MENPKKRNWKVLTSEYLARKPWFTVRHESIELPDGRRIPDYYVFEYPDWVNVIAITKEGKFVFIDQYRHGLGETDYEIPAAWPSPTMPRCWPRHSANWPRRRGTAAASGAS